MLIRQHSQVPQVNCSYDNQMQKRRQESDGALEHPRPLSSGLF